MKPFLALFLSVSSLFAEDAMSPAWRGQPQTQTIHIDFPTAANPTQGVLLVEGGFATGWRDSILMRTNVWDLGQAGYAVIAFPSNASRIRLQATYWTDGWLYGCPVLGSGLTPGESQVVQPWFLGSWTDSAWEWQPNLNTNVLSLSVAYPTGFVLSDLVIDVMFSPVTQVLSEYETEFQN